MMEIEVTHVDVYPDSDGLYGHEFKFDDRLGCQTELKLALPWNGFTEEELLQLRKGHHLYIPTIKKIEKLLMEKNGYEF